METVELTKSELRYIIRCVDTGLSEVEAGVADGLIDSSVLIDMQSALDILSEALKR